MVRRKLIKKGFRKLTLRLCGQGSGSAPKAAYLSRRLSKRPSKARIKLLVLDFDGVMTDDKVYVDENGKETVCCSRQDGLGIESLKKSGVKIMVISKEKNRVVSARCKKLRIKSIQGAKDKSKILKQLLKDLNLPPRQVCYLGNDITDLECIKLAGVGCAVRDSHPALFKVADYVTINKGGNGAVREICDLILAGLHKR